MPPRSPGLQSMRTIPLLFIRSGRSPVPWIGVETLQMNVGHLDGCPCALVSHLTNLWPGPPCHRGLLCEMDPGGLK